MSESRSFYVYILFRPWNGIPCYVGKGKGARFLRHDVYGEKHTNSHLARIMIKAGAPLPKVKIREFLTEREAFEIEIALIAAIGRTKHGGPLVNATDGGEGTSGHTHSNPPERRARISASKMGHVVSETTREKLRVSNLGKSPSVATREKISSALKASETSTKHIADLANRSRGIPLSPEHREKVRLANLGAKRSDSARVSMSVAQKKRFENSIGKTKPWVAMGISRRSWYRQNKPTQLRDVPPDLLTRKGVEVLAEARAKIAAMA